jgi:lipopolysaccharide biosynthesis glycosyltransferase
MNVKLKKVEHLKNFKGSNSYYTNVMVKLRVFQLFEYDRVIYMDSDMMVRKNLDHLFSLPENVHLAASRVTNQKNTDPQRFCSCFMVIKPTPKIWERIMGYYDSDDGYVKDNLYDMDLLNKEFRSDVILLPGTYGVLTAIWDNATSVDHHEQIRGWYQQILGEASNVTTRHELFDASQVLHFTPNKPMVERTLTHIKRNRPDADPRYFATFERWFSLASYVCPFDKYNSLHRYDQHKWSKYQGSHQYSDYFASF